MLLMKFFTKLEPGGTGHTRGNRTNSFLFSSLPSPTLAYKKLSTWPLRNRPCAPRKHKSVGEGIWIYTILVGSRYGPVPHDIATETELSSLRFLCLKLHLSWTHHFLQTLGLGLGLWFEIGGSPWTKNMMWLFLGLDSRNAFSVGFSLSMASKYSRILLLLYMFAHKLLDGCITFSLPASWVNHFLC